MCENWLSIQQTNASNYQRERGLKPVEPPAGYRPVSNSTAAQSLFIESRRCVIVELYLEVEDAELESKSTS